MNNDSHILYILKRRGLIFQISDFIKLSDLIVKKKISIYCGFDPTADSLHVGHLLPIVCLRFFQKCGFFPYILLGGATCMVGDPSFKKYERKRFSLDEIIYNQERIKKQLLFFFRRHDNIKNNIFFCDNYTWFKNISILDFLKNIGQYFSINSMIHKESVKNRLLNIKNGISFTEFSYTLLQAYDFSYLFKKYGVMLQIGGSDQWGNIIAGIHLIKKLYKYQVYGLTIPLFTKTNGDKFGKTETDTVWLDPQKTSPYKFYQFWVNISDDKVNSALKLFTFLNDNQINFSTCDNNFVKNITYKKKLLADTLTRFVHGKKNLFAVKRIIDCLFGRKLIQEIQEDDFTQLLKDGIPHIICNNPVNLSHILLISKLSSSLSQSRRMIASGGIYVNNILKKTQDYIFQKNDYIFGKYTLIRKGKKNFMLIYWKF
ncbi:tyrosyl-tRNA synthetase [Buchnera aphidicola (Cinara tujafilina)]|uniref:Tyrosine--tRNA ligase n=1 Tax=Buchnera aphidicola (Cinara tujafilina) TaxID=261317 RepID=F7WZ18_9GAMM|nr:tyrosine--tRNA ligase [Buchnera aphidicola]AEH39668.1 tyrosyl-tRNA synthetase [Buchnera aphidicola (Cinara tujafilina)]